MGRSGPAGVQDHRPGEAAQGQIAVDQGPVQAVRLHPGVLEGDRRVFLYVEKIWTLQVLAAAPRRNRWKPPGFPPSPPRPPPVADQNRQVARDLVELAANPAHHHMSYCKNRGAVIQVDKPFGHDRLHSGDDCRRAEASVPAPFFKLNHQQSTCHPGKASGNCTNTPGAPSSRVRSTSPIHAAAHEPLAQP